MIRGQRKASQASWSVDTGRGRVPHSMVRADDHRLIPKDTMAQRLLKNA